MKILFSRLPAALVLAGACAFATGALAQDSKQALASKLAQLQLRIDSAAMVEQLTMSAVQVPLGNWAARVDQEVPAERQEQVREQLDVELQKFADTAHKTIEARTAAAAEAALVPIYMEKLSADELKTIIAYLESPASTKLQELGAEAGNAWAQRLIEDTRAAIEKHIQDFDAAAGGIVGQPAASK